MRILIIDDDEVDRKAIKRALSASASSLEISEAPDARSGLSLLEKGAFDCILLDYRLPDSDGLAFAQELMDGSNGATTPIVMLTGERDENIAVEALKIGIQDYMPKSSITTGGLDRAISHAIERQRQRIQTLRLLEINPDGMLVVDDQEIILYANSAAATLFDREAAHMCGENFGFSVSGQDRTELTLGAKQVVEMRVASIDWNGSSAWLITLRDISARKQTEEQLHQLARYDQLTGLANRNQCLDYLSKALARAARHRSSVAVFFLDLDRFKDINDSLGHAAGDLLLKNVAQRLKKCLRAGDLAARFGGDEFALVVDELSQAEDAGQTAQKILDVLAAPHQILGQKVQVSSSIGIATFPQCGKDPETLLKAADTAMYHVKDLERNNYKFFEEEMQRNLLQRLRLEQDLRLAIERNEFFLLYQPQVDVTRSSIVGMEALLRWQHPELGLISPGDFIPVAEKAGLIAAIGEWVLQTACSQVQAWHGGLFSNRNTLQNLTVAANISIGQMGRNNFGQILSNVLQETDLEPRYLELELTESTVMDDPESTIAELDAIRGLGVAISVDDFGTGYSSLSYLRRLPLTTLKIDQSFVADLAEDPGAEVIVKTIIAMAHSLGLRVIAEGVETTAQRDFLKNHQCDIMQGYYFSRPVPFEQATQILNYETNLPASSA